MADLIRDPYYTLLYTIKYVLKCIAALGPKCRMTLYFRDRAFSHVYLILHMANSTYSAVLGCHVANTITTFVYNIRT